MKAGESIFPIIFDSQLYVFLWSLFAGTVVGFIYDIFRLLRKAIRTSVIVIHMEDLVFWLCASIVILIVLFNCNDGELRWYEFFGILLGAVFYFATLSRFIIGVSLYVGGRIKFLKEKLLKKKC